MPTPEPVCAFCHLAKAPRVRLDKEGGRSILTMCLPCLRSAMVKKAALSEQRSVARLQQDAEEYGLHLWRSGHAAYLLPDLPPRGVAAHPPTAP